MHKLDKETTRDLVQALDKMNGALALILQIADHPPLHLKRQGNIDVAGHAGFFFSIGVLHATDPITFQTRMIFIVIDCRKNAADTDHVDAFPLSYGDDVNGVAEIGAEITGGKVRWYNERIQQSLAVFARHWLLELRTAEYF